jgi:hypothetical protein
MKLPTYMCLSLGVLALVVYLRVHAVERAQDETRRASTLSLTYIGGQR